MKHISDEEMFRLVDGECTPDEQMAFQTHLRECAGCKALYTEIATLGNLSRRAKAIFPSLNNLNSSKRFSNASSPFKYNTLWGRVEVNMS